MVIMTDIPLGKVDKEETATYFILDETGEELDSSVIKIERPTAGKENQGAVAEDLKRAEEQIQGEELAERAGDENINLSNSSETSMRSSLSSKSTSATSTPGSSASMRRRGSKRKRKQTFTTPVNPKKKQFTGKKNKKKKKSVIVLDSDSEPETNEVTLPDVSIVEIDDDSQSVIVLSDDEVGVCTGSLSMTKNPSKPLNAAGPTGQKAVGKAQTTSAKLLSAMAKAPAPTAKPQTSLAVEDLTGNYITDQKSQEAPAQAKFFELYQPLANQSEKKTGLRPVVIDGCNVAFGHGRDRFSSLGLKICVDYFKKMGHEVRAFVPQFRKTHSATTDPQLLDAMEKDGTLSFTPSRRTDGKMIVSYDDRFIVQYADANGGVIVSRDNYRDLLNENPEWKETVHKRLLMFTWVGDTIMFPKDPLGRGGPTLQEFLKF